MCGSRGSTYKLQGPAAAVNKLNVHAMMAAFPIDTIAVGIGARSITVLVEIIHLVLLVCPSAIGRLTIESNMTRTSCRHNGAFRAVRCGERVADGRLQVDPGVTHRISRLGRWSRYQEGRSVAG